MTQTLKHRWGLEPTLEDARKADCPTPPDARTTERKKAAMALGVNPDNVDDTPDPRTAKKRAKVSLTLAERTGVAAKDDQPETTGAERLRRNLGSARV